MKNLISFVGAIGLGLILGITFTIAGRAYAIDTSGTQTTCSKQWKQDVNGTASALTLPAGVRADHVFYLDVQTGPTAPNVHTAAGRTATTDDPFAPAAGGSFPYGVNDVHTRSQDVVNGISVVSSTSSGTVRLNVLYVCP